MNLSIRNRIALYYAAATGLLTAVVFLVLYAVIQRTVYDHLDSDLDAESMEVLKSVVVLSNQIVFANEHEWLEREHGQIEVNPMFLQVVDSSGTVLRTSSNLRNQRLRVDPAAPDRKYACLPFQTSTVRQLQLPIHNPRGRTLGYLVVAMPQEEAVLVLTRLRTVLFVTFPVVLVLVFFTSRFIAARSVAPIHRVTMIAEHITSENLDERIAPPRNRDELYRLTATINRLLDRLRDAVVRERQFTADASHELRTPLAALKGTLEVLIRRPRSVEHYEEKVRYCISEVDRMSELVEDLLLLARHESTGIKPSMGQLDLKELIRGVITRVEPMLNAKRMRVICDCPPAVIVHADHDMTEVMLQNILSNAIKYSPEESTVSVGCSMTDRGTLCMITDRGIGIPEEQLARVFDRFYRTDQSRNSETVGSGLGLAIVKRLADLQHLDVSISSKQGHGTSVNPFLTV
jgi:two-component system heavy metal sensor histidine kinase CusS